MHDPERLGTTRRCPDRRSPGPARGRVPLRNLLFGGYAIECRLKALVIRRLAGDPGIILRVAGFQGDVRTHDFNRLLKHFGLEAERDVDRQGSPQLLDSWNLVFKWDEQKRYDFFTASDAQRLIDAVIDPVHGVLAWINKRL